MDAKIFKWNDLPTDKPMPLIERKRVIGENVMVSQVLLTKGFVLESHYHQNEQFVCIHSGVLKFGLGTPGSSEYREVTLGAGEVMQLPPNLPHSATAIETALVWDIFSPPSQMTGVDQQK